MTSLTGTPNQIEWANEIRPRVGAEFDRVAKAFHEVSASQAERDRNDTLAVIAILEEKRLEVMARTSAGYFIEAWQELGAQVRQLIAADPRYQAIKAARAVRDLQETQHAI
ncbi:MAG: hypothetical protein ACKV2U_16290 [Bryobacteraceae bacterium]